MVKLVGSILIIAASTAVGFTMAETMKKRLVQLKELQRSVIQLQNEIMYTRTALPEACLKVSVKSKQPVGKIFEKVSDMLLNNVKDSVYDAFIEVLAELKSDLNFSREDLDVILDLAKALGESDIEGHKKVFLLAEDSIKRSIEDADVRVLKNTKMYRYLGFSFGAAVAILLI